MEGKITQEKHCESQKMPLLAVVTETSRGAININLGLALVRSSPNDRFGIEYLS